MTMVVLGLWAAARTSPLLSFQNMAHLLSVVALERNTLGGYRLGGGSLGSFSHFEGCLPYKVKRQLQQVYDDLGLELMYPAVYPSLQDLHVGRDEDFVSRFRLFEKEDSRETDRLPAVVAYASV